jgi:hypothetical protein
MKLLSLFLSTICESEYFKSSEAFVSFLTQADRDVFDTKMKEFNHMAGPVYVEDIRTLDGSLEIGTCSSEKHYSNINGYFKLQKQIMERINSTLHKYLSHMKSASHNLDNLHRDFFSLYTLNKKVYMKDEINKNYKELSKYFKDWKRIVQNQNAIVKENIKDFLKEIRRDNGAYMEVIKERDELNTKYHSDIVKLNTKKDKLWSQMDTGRWELNPEIKYDKAALTSDKQYAYDNMCFKETSALKNLHSRLLYMNKISLDELKRLIGTQCCKYKMNFKQFIDSFYPTLTEVRRFYNI